MIIFCFRLIFYCENLCLMKLFTAEVTAHFFESTFPNQWIQRYCCFCFEQGIDSYKYLSFFYFGFNSRSDFDYHGLIRDRICVMNFILRHDLSFLIFYSFGFFDGLAGLWPPENHNCCLRSRNFHLLLLVHSTIIFRCFDLLAFCSQDLLTDWLQIDFHDRPCFTSFDSPWYA